MKDKELYTKDEMALFESMEKILIAVHINRWKIQSLDEKRSYSNKLQAIQLSE